MEELRGRGRPAGVPPIIEGSLFLVPSQVAVALGVSPRTIHRMTQEGTIPSAPLGNRRLIPRAWLDAKLAAAGQPKSA